MSLRNVEELIHHMPAVARAAENEWAAEFARSIIKQSKWRNWKPSPKQEGIMRRLVSELFADSEELEVIEKG